MEPILGKKYIIDKGFRNSGEVELVSISPKKMFCVVRDPNTGGEWETMTNRLSEIETHKN